MMNLNRVIGLGVGLLVAHGVSAAGIDDRLPGLVARYTDDDREVSQVVLLPELGLAADESPHPAIKPVFTAVFEGMLWVSEKGRYVFDHVGVLSLDGKPVDGELELDTGDHELRLMVTRGKGAIRSGLSWQSDSFIKEPVPPSVLWHKKNAAPASPSVSGNFPSPSHRIAQMIASKKCASCHDGHFLATMHHVFAPHALPSLMRHAGSSKWVGKPGGPVLKESRAMTQLATDLLKLPLPERQRGKTQTTLPDAVKMVSSKGGLACVACHGIRHHQPQAESKGPNLSSVTQRVSYDWFVRWMTNPGRYKPGVPMPAFFAAQSPTERQRSIDTLWDYMKQGSHMSLPAELKVDPKQFILKPTTSPMIHRIYLRLPDDRELVRAICVGLPNGVSYCFDADTCQLVYVWTGGYLDMTPHWKNQSLHPVPIVGDSFFLFAEEEGLRIGDHAPIFRGYELVNGVPKFEFTIGKTSVQLLVESSTPAELKLSYTVGAHQKPVTFIAPSRKGAVAIGASAGTWNKERLTLPAKGKTAFVLTLTKGEQK